MTTPRSSVIHLLTRTLVSILLVMLTENCRSGGHLKDMGFFCFVFLKKKGIHGSHFSCNNGFNMKTKLG